MKIKFKKDNPQVFVESVRFCEKCGSELPTHHKGKSCKSCKRETVTQLGKGVATFGTVIMMIIGVILKKKT